MTNLVTINSMNILSYGSIVEQSEVGLTEEKKKKEKIKMPTGSIPAWRLGGGGGNLEIFQLLEASCILKA